MKYIGQCLKNTHMLKKTTLIVDNFVNSSILIYYKDRIYSLNLTSAYELLNKS